MNNHRPRAAKTLPVLLSVPVIAAAMGASCSPRIPSSLTGGGPPAPVVLTNTSTSAEIVAAINQNTARVQTYQAASATIAAPSSAGLPLVNASIAVDRPRRVRLRATTALTGPEIDLGSNDERFWFWARRNEPPALYTARHDAWASSPNRGAIPVDPAWLVDALGLVGLDPAAAYVGPTPRGDGSLELRTAVADPSGTLQRVLVVDAQTALVREQHLYDAAGSLTASVLADRFRYDPASGASLPERVRLVAPQSELDLTISTGSIAINAPIGEGGQLWAPPQIGDAPVVDLTAPGVVPNLASRSFATPLATEAVALPTLPGAAALSQLQPPTASVTPGAVTPTPTALPTAPTAGFVGLPQRGRVIE